MSSDPKGPDPLAVDEAELQALVDGCLPEHRRAEVMAWVDSDPSRRERVAAYKKQRQLLAEIRCHLGAFDTVGFEPDLQRELIDGLERRRRRRQIFLGVSGLAAAIALTIGAAFGYLNVPFGGKSTLTSVVAEDTEFPFGGTFVTPVSATAGTDGEASVNWLSQRLTGETLHLPDLSVLGLHLTTAGILPARNAPAIRLAYADDKGGHISLFVAAASDSARQAFTMMPEGQLSLHWRHGHLLFALVGSVDSSKLLDIMRLLVDGSAAGLPEVQRPGDKQATADPAIQPVGLPTEATTAANVPAQIAVPADTKAAAQAPVEVAPATPVTATKVEQPKPL